VNYKLTGGNEYCTILKTKIVLNNTQVEHPINILWAQNTYFFVVFTTSSSTK